MTGIRGAFKEFDFFAPHPGSWLMISVPLPHLHDALIAPPFPRGFTMMGYQSAQDAAAFFAGQTTLLDEVEAWLADNLPGQRSSAARDDFHGRLHVAIPADTDVVEFMLVWGDVIIS